MDCSIIFFLIFLLSTIFTLPCCSLKANVWTTFNDVALKTNAISLGQGFPDWNPPQFVLDSLSKAVNHQYARPAGNLNLVTLLSQRYGKHLKRNIDPFTEIAITVGASQALYLTLMSILHADDEVIMFEPFFELYLKQIALTGAKPKFVPMTGTGNSKWTIDADNLKKVITPNSKVLLLNTPHNPTGKVFSFEELNAIADVVRENPNLIVISDEVYKYTIYDELSTCGNLQDSDPLGHYHFASLPGMWDRTITISSCGKTFSVTGWQIGWVVSSQRFVSPIQSLLPCVQFCAPSPIQDALATALPQADLPYEGFKSYYEWLRHQFLGKRRLLEAGLDTIGIDSIPSGGGFFLMGRLPTYSKRDLEMKLKTHDLFVSDDPHDWMVCKALSIDFGVTAIPASPFFSEPDQYDKLFGRGLLARFAFCKKSETLEEVNRRLRKSAP